VIEKKLILSATLCKWDEEAFDVMAVETRITKRNEEELF
jgi:hypothetical protein